MGIGLVVFLAVLATLSAEPQDVSPAVLVRNMQSAYEKVKDYRMKVIIRRQGGDGVWNQEEFTYTYKKPHHVRIDFKTPRSGTMVVYPDKEGKVLVRPWGLRALDLHLSPESFLLRDPSGQRVDQTDLGLLIGNISKSINERRRGPLELFEEQYSFVLKVLSEDHFRRAQTTSYSFIIDKESWLPMEILEATPEGFLKRRIIFEDLQINPGITQGFFQTTKE